MACNWQAFLNLVPPRLRGEVDKLGKEQLQELRLRLQGEPAPGYVVGQSSV